jgi:ferredoxin
LTRFVLDGTYQMSFDYLMRVSIDPDKCQGHARCALIASTVFDLDDAGKGMVLVDEVPGEDEAEVREAALSCPEGAISLVD